MKFAVLTILFLISLACPSKAQNEESEVKKFREIRDQGFRNVYQTPLTREDLATFKGLEYFEIDKRLAVKAKFEKTTDAKVFMMPTNIGTTHKYFKYGVLTFEIGGRSFALNAYQSEFAAQRKTSTLFVPFKDMTNGRETYGAGRYLDIQIPSGDEAVLDFNLAYNPSCAYGNNQFSCTIPPKENFLQTEIKAGEKIYKHSVQTR